MPFATTFVFWSSLVKAIGMAGGPEEQGRCFGIYFASNAVFATIISTANMFAYTTFSANDSLPSGFCGVTLNVAVFIAIAIMAILIFFRETKVPSNKAALNSNDSNVASASPNHNELHDSSGDNPSLNDGFKLSDVRLVLKNKNV